MKRALALVVLAIILASHASAEVVDFVRDVRPIFEKHCYSCHGEAKQKSGLRLDIKSEAFKGGDGYGELVVPGSVDDSPLIELVTSDDEYSRMPPGDHPLSDTEITTLTRWVEQDAVWPDGVDLAVLEDRLDHWSFKPLADVEVPDVANQAWPRNDVDRFVLARLEQAGLRPAPPADPRIWLRRVTLDLTGLPPTPDEMTAFLNDVGDDDSAYEAAVDRLLQSPRYGERWAQHWLDVVRYADTHGFEVNTERPNAWPYRDYVIDAFNNDTPYDQFIREQIVGDALDQNAATGFLITASVLLPGQIGKDEPSKRLARQDSIDEIVVNISQTFLGLSVGCARCHDHKFDPISQHDYYAMQAFVAGVEYADRELDPADAKRRRSESAKLKSELAKLDNQLARFTPLAASGATRPAINSRLNTDRFTPVQTKRVRFTIHATNKLEPCIDELEIFDGEGNNLALASRGATVTSSGSKTQKNRHELRFLNDGRYGNSRSWMSNQTGKGWVEVELAKTAEIQRIAWGRDREGKFADRLATEYTIEVADERGEWTRVADASDRAPLDSGKSKPLAFSTDGLSADEAAEATKLNDRRSELEKRIARLSDIPRAFAGKFRTPDAIHLLRRGDPEQPEDLVAPTVLASFGSVSLPADAPEQQRRAVLADWITDPANPLTARVMVNRIWQGHFGMGIVETASDFGRMGTKPTHPELLDWMARQFIDSGWSVKQLHREIILSATYRQSNRFDEDGFASDADGRLLWRFPTRRLDAEAIRDAMLMTSGRLDYKMGGRGFNLFNQRGGLSGFTPVESFSGDGLRRMIYAHKVRRERDAVFGAFDCPDGGQSTARRIESTTPIQALNLFNSRFTLEQSEAFATRVKSESNADELESQIRRVYQIALNREPAAEEVSDAMPVVRDYGLQSLCRALFNSNEFLFLP
ncbi:DUF1553 domain-containing protein [Novipirellula maiorica]|uniref:DUF1553 domain-containing protein n=1 Tax=Novipirellula maiorica TaxID=1265734 RepID=UPI000349146D|nr:DUF1553 domain-containing protein [Rhodopirellula maiorica]